jgi:hypothetical protein
MYHQVTAHIRRIEAVEKDLKALGAGSATKEDVSRVRAEVKKLYDGLHVGKKCSVFADREVLTDFSRILGSASTCVGNS